MNLGWILPAFALGIVQFFFYTAAPDLVWLLAYTTSVISFISSVSSLEKLAVSNPVYFKREPGVLHPCIALGLEMVSEFTQQNLVKFVQTPHFAKEAYHLLPLLQ